MGNAIIEALKTAVDYIQKVLNVSWAETYLMASQVMDLNISQIVNPMKTVRASIPKYICNID
ncbi:hypothetical protein [Miniphocaeibacter massiliensis]|uniref:hypothetical protein n=1 Tax=Miniphocaeibacter massiliensis TaxID=2041841 RepID=UPI000C1C3489|nr:hypothetical protein [Miniphocaeibacter massiliensis]